MPSVNLSSGLANDEVRFSVDTQFKNQDKTKRQDRSKSKHHAKYPKIHGLML